ncbi:Pimeloyl-ACP methyl ester carboxylesterase [Duganella sp. CF517]|uniref:alpha/beta fold hydrolase n=1 Tax=Duganella sp. CF517 TaxID=1881038 RepID=UPI0008B90A62|nr:alpha/beta hydrolase [Duganella sp. CF517]SEN36614.1 Pimeloyl-ACP methyl ester carboxylesterase [Duganella sp. CF517]
MNTPSLGGLLLGAAVCLAPSARAADAPGTDGAFAKPQLRVDIGGRKLNLYCSGSGATTVLFDGPAGDAGWAWFKVQPAVARHTRACTYDRPGYGFSDPSKRPNTSQHVAEDLHQGLAAAGIKPPYLLVGNSIGGANAQVFAYRYPGEVTGMVLVEPQTEDESTRTNKASGGMLDKVYAMVAAHNAECLRAAGKGFKPGGRALADCIGEPADFYGPVLGPQVLAAMKKPSYWRTVVGEYQGFGASDDQLRALRKPFGDLPLLVLTRGVSPYAIPGRPQSAVNKAMEDENEAIHKELAALSTRGAQRVVPGAGHAIQSEQPAVVTAAVLEMLHQIN